MNLDTTYDEDTEIKNGSSDNEDRVSACSQNGANNSPNNPVTEISDTPNNTRETYSEGNNIVTLGTTNEEDTELENHSGDDDELSQCMRFPSMWHFDKCRLGQGYAASC